ncbi:MAG: hypothetical protein ACM3MI_09795 [Clostridiales bacterium]
MKIEQQISKLKPDLDKLIETYKEQIEALLEKVKILVEVASDFDNNWVGAWASPSYNVYYDFIGNSGRNFASNEEKIQDYIEQKSAITFKEVQEQIPTILKAHRNFQEKLVTELSIIKAKENLESEVEILGKIENHEWGITSHDYVKMRRPMTVFTSDPETLLNKGLDTPPHFNIGGELFSFFSNLAAAENFQANSKRLLRQLEIKFSIEDSSSDNSEFINNLMNNFHIVATQIRNRYDNRDTLVINDEYDVQDLLNGLIRLEFDDVRPEEYTPSYAGSSTRVDFLLKKGKIVFEVKKTREGLKDKQVGDQLILDVQHYKAHPDCKRLICFVYDPENRIKNPRGLESDLNTLSSEEMNVEVYIRP